VASGAKASREAAAQVKVREVPAADKPSKRNKQRPAMAKKKT
jgi:hypothetical protein